MKNQSVLVIGGAGYIGSHVVLDLLHSGYKVTVYDNLYSGRRENLFAGAEFIEGDILDQKLLGKVMNNGFDGIVHLAALKAAGESMTEPEKYAENNIAGTINILNAACGAGIPRIVFSSSAAVYGNPRYQPIDENHPVEPENFYGFTKLEIERFLAWYSKLKGLRYAALRYFNAAGYDPEGRVTGLERNPANLLPVVMEVAAGKRDVLKIFGDDYDTRDGTGVRDYIHVTDLAAAHLSALEYIGKNDRDLVVNLGSEIGLSVLEIVESARAVTGRPIPAEIVKRRPGDPAELVASSALAKDILGWEAKYSGLETLIRTMWKNYNPNMIDSVGLAPGL